MDIIFSLASLYIVSTTLYLVVLTIAAYLFNKKANPSAPPLKVAIIIPAHNEELQIGATIQGIRNSHYPDDRYMIFVIADNCEDETAALAKTTGTRVFERTDPVNRGKGQALDWFLKKHETEYKSFDAIAIIDADTFLDPNFLLEVSASLSHPEIKVVQGYYGVSNPRDNWRTAISSAALNVFHHLRLAGRDKIGGTVGLKGNGMAFRTEILQKYGWPAYSIVEDIEFSVCLLLNNILVHYNPDAIVYGEMATQAKQAETQRKRWEGGRFQAFRRFGPSLLKGYLKKREVQYLDGFMELFTPPLSILVMGQGLLFLLAIFLYPVMTALLLFCFIGITFYVFSGLFLRKAPLYVWCCLLAAPFFVLWKIPIYLKIVGCRNRDKWERTQRKAELRK